MVSKTNEQALEAAIEKSLTGITSEELKAGSQATNHGATYKVGHPTDFNMQYAIDERFFWEFLENTQDEDLEKVRKNSPNDWKKKAIRTLRSTY